jgi:hypothetical protein
MTLTLKHHMLPLADEKGIPGMVLVLLPALLVLCVDVVTKLAQYYIIHEYE